MNRCKTCKWWAGPVKTSIIKDNSGYGKCEHLKLSDDTHSDGAIDSEDYGGIYAGPEFGCVHHEAKEGVERKAMPTLKDFDKARFAQHCSTNKPGPNGIACPKCGAELWDSNPSCMLTSSPPQFDVHCPVCNHRDTRLV